MNMSEIDQIDTNKKERASTRKKKQAFLEAMEKSLGIVTTAMNAAGVKSRNTIKNWRAADEKFNAAYEECEERTCDFVETQLLKKIKAGDTTAIIFYAKTKLRDRGYTERTEITGADGKDLFAAKTDDELNATIAELKRRLDI